MLDGVAVTMRIEGPAPGAAPAHWLPFAPDRAGYVALPLAANDAPSLCAHSCDGACP
jgi:hypothetical protein